MNDESILLFFGEFDNALKKNKKEEKKAKK